MRKFISIELVLSLLIAMYIVAISKEPHMQSVTVEQIPIESREVPKSQAPEVEEVQEVKKQYFDVPLSEEMQDSIFEICEKYSICPALVIAVIERESQYDAEAIGDNGNSQGLMQIQEKWHEGRMQELNCTSLLNPIENVTVGVDYLHELFTENSDVIWVLHAYNGGRNYANKMNEASEYAQEIAERSAELEKQWN